MLLKTNSTSKKAWQVGNNLILACASSSEPGTFYPVLVKQSGNSLIVQHVCPSRKNCWHIKESVRQYREWRWWEPVPEKVITIRKPVILHPEEWREIPIPSQEVKIIEKLLSA